MLADRLPAFGLFLLGVRLSGAVHGHDFELHGQVLACGTPNGVLDQGKIVFFEPRLVKIIFDAKDKALPVKDRGMNDIDPS